MAEQTDIRRSTPRQATKSFGGPLARLVAGLVSADLLLICAGAAAEANPLIVLVAHVLLLAACAWCFPPAQSQDRTPWTFSMMLVFIAGPLGGAGAVLLALAESRGRPEKDILEAWYDRLSGEERPDPTRRIHEAILTGREFKPTPQGPRNFAGVIERGTLAEKQALLGHIALKYHRDYFPLLSSALRSPQSAVRAQAAAVFVKLKEQFRRRLHNDRQSGRAAQSADNVLAMLACARSILDCAESGFLDPSEAREALAEAKALSLNAASSEATATGQAMILCRIVAASGEDDGLLDRLLTAAPASCFQMRQLLARCLMAAGRHMELHRLLFPTDEDPGARAEALLASPAPGGGR